MLKIINGGKTPTLATKYSAAVDLYANTDVVIGAGETVKVPLGVCVDLNKIRAELVYSTIYDVSSIETETEYFYEEYEMFIKSHYLELHPRSSLRAKGLIASVGVIDLDFTDEIQLIIHNPINKTNTGLGMDGEMIWNPLIPYTIKKGDRISQIMLKEHKTYLMGFESDTERIGGIGSTND